MKKGWLLFLIPLALATVFAMGFKDKGKTYEALNNTERVTFIKQYGWDISESPIEEAGFTLPQDYDAVYKEYNKIQNAAGMDIKPYMGKDVVRYTYLVKNHKKAEGRQVRANLLVHGGRIIAADVMVVEIDGFMHSINKTEYVNET
jgi:hypothetical protein